MPGRVPCLLALALALAPGALGAETLVAARTIRAGTVLAASDLALARGETPGGLSDPARAVGLEARVALYAGRPIRAGDLGPPALVDRNQLVRLSYARGPLRIRAEGRALDRGGVGDLVRVMNLSSRATVTGTVTPEGIVRVGGAQN